MFGLSGVILACWELGAQAPGCSCDVEQSGARGTGLRQPGPLAEAALVVTSDFEKGATWAGAIEQLEKLLFVPVLGARAPMPEKARACSIICAVAGKTEPLVPEFEPSAPNGF